MSQRAQRRSVATFSVCRDTSTRSPLQPDGTRLAFAVPWSVPAAIVNSEEGRTHMMRERGTLIVWSSLIAAGLLAAACTDQPNVSMAPNRPNFWLTPSPAVCTGGKWTGGGRIDPAYPDPRAGSNYDGADEDLAHEEEYFAYTLPNMTGK